MTKTYYLGTAVRITDIVQPSNIDGVNITIISPLSRKVVEDVAMTASSDSVFKYVYQSDSNGAEGEYIVICKAIRGDNTGVSKQKFKLEDPE